MAAADGRELNIVIGGEAGQGVQTVGRLLSEALARSGYSILVNQTYHSRIRGGHNTYAVRCGITSPPAPRRCIDLLIALNEETVHLHRKELSDKGLLIKEKGNDSEDDNAAAVSFPDLAGKEMKNTVALGVASGLLGLDQKLLDSLMKKSFSSKEKSLQQENSLALEN